MNLRTPPLWKLERETRRIGLQVSTVVSAPFNLLGRKLYDLTRTNRIRRTPGQLPAQDCVAIYLIYQPDGVLPSTLLACQFLNRNGFSVHVVSNAALSEGDREALAANSTLVLERPNFGYDFGGYRDGILDVLEADRLPRRLLVMNDSVWFPLFDDAGFMDQMRETPVDIFGPVTNRYPRKPHKDHICSFMFSFSNQVLRSPGFSSYWRNLRMSDNKMTVINSNEKNMTYTLSQMGFTAGSLYGFQDIVRISRTLSADALQDYVAQQASGMQPHALDLLELRATMADDAVWADAVRAAIEARRLGTLVHAVHPMIAISALRLPMLKKDRAPYCRQMRKTLQTLPEFHEIPAIIRGEIAGWDNR